VGPHMSHDLWPCLGPRQLGQLRSSVPDRLDSCGCGGFGREEAEKRLRQSSSRLSYRGSYREEEIFLGGECERVVGDGDFSGAQFWWGPQASPRFFAMWVGEGVF
jgi:hypothetical protein